jgi:transcriptional regulator with XRE-family HTH domain
MKRERLILERKKKKKTQLEVALDLGISQVYVRKLESGTVNPGRNTMIKFENYYGLGSKKLFPDIFFELNDKKFIKTGTE